jgi:hypothetical protein
VHVEVRVVDVHVPAEQRPDEPEHGGVVEQTGQVRAVRDRAELVQRDAARSFRGPRVRGVDCGPVPVDLVGGQCAGDDQEAVPVERGALVVGHRRAQRGCGQRQHVIPSSKCAGDRRKGS